MKKTLILKSRVKQRLDKLNSQRIIKRLMISNQLLAKPAAS
jgi:hypothetical protein